METRHINIEKYLQFFTIDNDDVLNEVLICNTQISYNTFKSHGILYTSKGIAEETHGHNIAIDLSFVRKTDNVSKVICLLYKKLLTLSDHIDRHSKPRHVIINTMNSYGYIQHPDKITRNLRIDSALK